MKKYTLSITLLILFSFHFSYSQNFSFGPTIGSNYYGIKVAKESRPLLGGNGTSLFNYGFFFDYKAKENLGIKTSFLFGKTKETDYQIVEENIYKGHIFYEIELKKLTIQSLLKINFKGDYTKGINLQSGLRFSYIIDAESDINQEIADGFHKKSNLGLLFGIGINFLKDFDIQAIADYGFTNILSGNSKANTFGVIINLSYNLDSILNK